MLDKEKYNDYTLGIKRSMPDTDGKVIVINPATDKPFPKVEDIYVDLRNYLK